MPSTKGLGRVLVILGALALVILVLFDVGRPRSVLREVFRPGSARPGIERLTDDLRSELREGGPTRPVPLPR